MRSTALIAMAVVSLVLAGCSAAPQPAPTLVESDVVGQWVGTVASHEITFEFLPDQSLTVDNLPVQAWFDDDHGEPLDWNAALTTVGTWDVGPDSSAARAYKVYVDLRRTPDDPSSSLTRPIFVRWVDGEARLVVVYGPIDEMTEIPLERR